MKRPGLAIALLLVVWSLAACRAPMKSAPPPGLRLPAGMPLGFVGGTYDLVGRRPDAETSYSGKAEIRVLADSLVMMRRIGKAVVQASGILKKNDEGVQVLRFCFDEGGVTYEATYLIDGDLDNYARLSGYIYRREGGTRVPGIEALFSNHYRE